MFLPYHPSFRILLNSPTLRYRHIMPDSVAKAFKFHLCPNIGNIVLSYNLMVHNWAGQKVYIVHSLLLHLPFFYFLNFVSFLLIKVFQCHFHLFFLFSQSLSFKKVLIYSIFLSLPAPSLITFSKLLHPGLDTLVWCPSGWI